MNYSTFKKVVACSMVSALAVSAAQAQDTTATTMSSSAKTFGGTAQYRTWSIGLNAGVMAPVVAIGGSNDFTNWNVDLGYGLNIRKQLTNYFSLELDMIRGGVSGDNSDKTAGVGELGRKSFKTDIDYAGSINAVFNFGSVNFLKRSKSLMPFVKAGWGTAAYDWEIVQATGGSGTTTTKGSKIGYGPKNTNSNVHEQYFPVGAGLKFKLSDRVNFNLGYNMYFLDGDNLDGTKAKLLTKDKWSYGYGGVEFSLGSSAKPSLEWSNPVAMMYDELKDPELRKEVEALRGRVDALEGTVNQLNADADGDGVSDKFDKCAGTPAGTPTDGTGCPIVHPEMVKDTLAAGMGNGAYSNIQFEFDSSVLRTSSYPTLDKVSADLKANPSTKLTLNGYASAEGTDSYNMRLSKDRANAVKTYLVNSGVPAKTITVKGNGEANPIADNSTEEGRMINRRVEFKK